MRLTRAKITIALFLCVCLFNPSNIAFAKAPGVGSPGAALYNTTTQQFLLEKNGDTPAFPASTTKILTALIVLEENQLNEKVIIPSDFRNPGGSHIAIDHGEEFTVEQLLYATLVESANDAALALAIHNAGSQQDFAKKMNQKATALGAVNSNFVNPHGLHNKEHYSTPKDLALIASAAMKIEMFRKMVNTERYTIPSTNKKAEPREYLRTSNRFIRDSGVIMNYKGQSIPIYDPEVDGIKTGYTTEANNCLVSSKPINGGRIISVILGAGVDNLVYADSKALLDYGLSDFTEKRFVTAGDVVTNIKVAGAEDAGLNLVAKSTLISTIPIDAQNPEPKVDIKLLETPKSAIKKGMVLGKVTYSWNDKIMASTDLLASRDVTTKPLVGALLFQAEPTWMPFFLTQRDYIVIGVKALLVLIIWRTIAVYLRKERRKKARAQKLKLIRESIQNGGEESLYTSAFPSSKVSQLPQVHQPIRKQPVVSNPQNTGQTSANPSKVNQSMHLVSLTQMQRTKKSGKNKKRPT